MSGLGISTLLFITHNLPNQKKKKKKLSNIQILVHFSYDINFDDDFCVMSVSTT